MPVWIIALTLGTMLGTTLGTQECHCMVMASSSAFGSLQV